MNTCKITDTRYSIVRTPELDAVNTAIELARAGAQSWTEYLRRLETAVAVFLLLAQADENAT